MLPVRPAQPTFKQPPNPAPKAAMTAINNQQQNAAEQIVDLQCPFPELQAKAQQPQDKQAAATAEERKLENGDAESGSEYYDEEDGSEEGDDVKKQSHAPAAAQQ